jgi:acetyl-CoA synthetase
MYELSLSRPAKFWRDDALELGGGLTRNVPVNDDDFVKWNFDCDKGRVFVEWMPGARANMSYSCLDRHVEAGKGNDVAFHW